jgi:hypothetical protein
MRNKKRQEGQDEGGMFFADFNADNYEVSSDWRYRFIVPYIRHSCSYQAVRDKYRGKKITKENLPKDAKLVFQVADYFDLLSVASDSYSDDQLEWWNSVGKSAFGFAQPMPCVYVDLFQAGEVKTVHKGGRLIPMFLVEIPLNLTLTQAMQEVREHLQEHIDRSNGAIKFGMPLPDAYKADFKLERSKFRKLTLTNGIEALAMYKAGVPLWKIGNNLDLSPSYAIDEQDATLDQDEAAEKKRVLSIMARKLINTASLIAENAARGRFPSDKPFPEAVLTAYTRKAGRPFGSKRPKRQLRTSVWGVSI